MSKLDRRITNLERVMTPEMVFVTYLGNPEPQSLRVGGQRLSRRPGELWDDFKDRVQATAPREQFAVGDLSVFERPVD
jgi:hypothetical protein